MVAADFKLNCLEPVIYRRDSNGVPTIMYPCGKCIVCKEAKRRQWAIRMENEKSVSRSVFFVTLTYDDNHLYYSHDDCPASVSKEHYSKFLKLLRKNLPFKIRFFGVAEYGSESYRPHYHFMFFLPEYCNRSWFRSIVSKCWTYGFNTVKDGTSSRMYYIAKYTVKGSSHPYGTESPFQSSSINPPIGFDIFERNYAHLDCDYSRNYMVSSSNRKCSIPRSFENKYKARLDDVSRDSVISPSLTRKTILQKNAGHRLQDYLKQFNKLTPREFMEMRDAIERRYYKKHKKITNI